MSTNDGGPAEQVCRAHYNYSDRKSCGRCPIVSACHVAVVPLTRQALDAHNARLNDAALAALQWSAKS